MNDEFQKIVDHKFEFLIFDYGFKHDKSYSNIITYKSHNVLVNIFYDSIKSYEVGCTIGRIDNYRNSLDVPFDLSEIIKCQGYPEKDCRRYLQATNQNTLIKCLNEIADKLKTYAIFYLNGSSEAFDLVAEFRARESAVYALETQMKFMREQLQKYWDDKNYQKVVELLKPFKNHIKPSELKKLQYALRNTEGP